jgi:asparagine synthase (glutamine-hydrolysing)
MCGILGFVGTRWIDQIEDVLPTIASRGPDKNSILRGNNFAFGHTRLSVIDIEGGGQPMQTLDGRYTIVFNGEIYNANLLREELRKLGLVFRSSHSDTEVLLNGYRAWGNSVLKKLDGMFAFAIWDNHEQQIFAARDKFGIKPFFYSQLGDGFIFSSTLAPFLKLSGFPRNLNAEALRDFLAFQASLAPDSFLEGVSSLPPANYLEYRFSKNVLQLKRWWEIPSASINNQSDVDLQDNIDNALQESVKRQVVADVPLGAFLSGGIDSSLMIHYMAQASSQPIDAFTLKFESKRFDESHHAVEVAKFFGCRHHFVEAPAVDADYLKRAIQDLDQPLADPAYVMTYALSERTKLNVTVAISGDGGDELFGGYPRYSNTEYQYPEKFWQKPVRQLIYHGFLPASLSRRTLSGKDMLLYQRVQTGPWPGRKNLAAFVSPEIFKEMHPDETMSLWISLVNEMGGHMDSDTLMRADLWTYLSENCLVKTDRASMAHGLETRVPMLGEPVVNAVMQLPASLHLKGGGKFLLTALAKKYLPRTVWDRPKHGFSVPLKELFNGAWDQLTSEYISKASSIAPFLCQKTLEQRWLSINKNGQSKRLMYTFLVLLIWLEKNQLTFNKQTR